MEAGNLGNLASEVLSRRGFLGGSAAVAAASFLAACESRSGGGGGGRGGPYASHPNYRFVFINHVTTNEFFVATRYGIADACALVGCQYQWTGSKSSNAGEMVDKMDAAINSKADGIAVSLVEATAFNEPTERALDAGIPVVAYNADASSSGNRRLAYIGQDLYLSGQEMGQRIVQEVDSGVVAGFIATPGQLNIQPRIDGAKAEIQASGKPIQFEQIATGAEIPAELSTIEAWYLGHKDVKGLYAVDAGSTQGVAEVMQKYTLASQGVKSGGYDLLTKTVSSIQQGHMGFAIDQQAYLQGFLPVLQLFLYKISGALTGPADVDTGVKFVTKSNLGTYATTRTRYQGTSSEQKVVSASS